MIKSIFLLFLALGLSLQVPVEESLLTEAESTKDTPNEGGDDVEEPELPEMNPYGECPESDDLFPTYLSDFKNCSIFYQCANGIPYMMTCRYPLEFSPTLKVCDFPERSGCLFDKISPYGMIGRCPPNLRPGSKKFLRDSEDNTIYYECVNGEAVLRQCPPGTVFTFRKNCEPTES